MRRPRPTGADVPADVPASVLGDLLDRPAVRSAALVDVASGMVLAAAGAPDDPELLGALHADLVRAAVALLASGGDDADLVVDAGPAGHHVVRVLPDPSGGHLALAAVVVGSRRVAERVRRRLRRVPLATLTAGPVPGRPWYGPVGGPRAFRPAARPVPGPPPAARARPPEPAPRPPVPPPVWTPPRPPAPAAAPPSAADPAMALLPGIRAAAPLALPPAEALDAPAVRRLRPVGPPGVRSPSVPSSSVPSSSVPSPPTALPPPARPRPVDPRPR